MKKACALVTLIALAPLSGLLAQDDITAIFDDLTDLSPPPAPQLTPSQPAPRPPAPATQLNPAPAPDNSTPIEKPKTEKLNIEATITAGKQAFDNGKYNEAQKYFDAVLHTDPHNKTAIRWARHIAAKKASREEKSYTATRTRMLEHVQAAWNTPRPEGKQPESNQDEEAFSEDELKTQALHEKLKHLRIPSITFHNADIQQVVSELSMLCPGINLAAFGTSETLLPPVTFSGTDLSVLEILDIVTQMSGTKYEVGPNRVTLSPVNYEPPQQMVSIEFNVMPSVGAKMALMNNENISGPFDVRGFFSNAAFPEGSSAQFNPEFNLLLVHNVPKHIEKIKTLLERYNKKALEERSRQVEIETKFIEVAQGSLDELGFEWTVGRAGSVISDDAITMAGGQKLFTDTLRTGSEAFRQPIGAAGRAGGFNSYTDTAGSMTDSLTGSAGELLIEKVSGVEVDLLIRALERQEGSDLLSAPKVLAKSGETASIHVGEIRSFPTAYDVVIERYSQPSLLPLDYKEVKTGVMLEVTPELDAEHHTIDLKLSPEIRELAGFDEQHVGTLFNDAEIDAGLSSDNENVGSAWVDYLTFSDQNRNVFNDRLIARMPVFKSRKVETAVTIEDGSTIAMGGLIKEKLETFRDSVPILGKIPLFGRLFRSEGERSVKRNLLIFVTANQVDATGYRRFTE